MFHFNDPLWIVSQCFGILALSAMFYSLQTKCKIRTLWATVAANLFFGVACAFLGNWVLAVICFNAAVRDVAYIWMDKKGYAKTHPMALIILFGFLSATVISVILTMSGWWYDWVLMFTASFIVVGYWLRGIHWIRLSRFTHAGLAIYNHVHFSNFLGLMLDGTAIISILIFYALFLLGKKVENARKVS